MVGMATRETNVPVFGQSAHDAKEKIICEALFKELPNVDGLRVVDLACGWGGIGARFAQRGAYVTFVDGRAESLRMAQALAPTQTFIHGDIMKLDLGQFELALCLGVLYHVGEPLKLLEKVAACAPIAAVESLCIDHDGVFITYLREDVGQIDYSITGDACRPSPGWIKSSLATAGFSDIVDLSPNMVSTPVIDGWAGQLYNWEFQRTCGWRRNDCHLRKLYVARK